MWLKSLDFNSGYKRFYDYHKLTKNYLSKSIQTLEPYLSYTHALPIKKITKIALTSLFTVGLIGAAYTWISTYFVKEIKKKTTTSTSSEKWIYSPIGQAAIHFAEKKLEAEACSSLIDQQNKVTRLEKLYWNVYFKDLQAVIQQHPKNLWHQKAVIDAADICMKIAYAISCFALEDLTCPSRSYLKESQKIFIKALTEAHSFTHLEIYRCASLYHYLREPAVWKGAEKQWASSIETPLIMHASPFYQEGTLQNSWNQLYNDYCEQMNRCIMAFEIVPNTRHINLAKKDTEIGLFPHAF